MSRKIVEVLANNLELLVNQVKNLKSFLPTQQISEMKDKVGVSVNPMTQDHALEILNIDLEDEVRKYNEENEVGEDEESSFNGLNPKYVMERFDILSEKNSEERGGSFYLRSKIYFAKEHIMADYDPELNISEYNPGQEHLAEEEAPEEIDEKDAKK
jgi:hypothetical protein